MRFNEIMASVIDYKAYRKTARLHKALGNERRIVLLEFLAQEDRPERNTVADLARRFRIPYKLVSRHLQILDQADLVERVRRGQEVGYRATALGRQALNVTP